LQVGAGLGRLGALAAAGRARHCVGQRDRDQAEGAQAQALMKKISAGSHIELIIARCVLYRKQLLE
jgi:hypothetical protein